MATTEDPASRPQDRHTRKRPFTGWMKRLANLKSSNSDTPNGSGKKAQAAAPAKSKKSAAKNNPYPESGRLNNADGNGQSSYSSPVTPHSNHSFTSAEAEDAGTGRRQTLTKSNKSAAPTVATHPDTVHSSSGRSKADTGNSNTVGGGSTFSSPNHSERSLTTTLTTIQSSAPSNVLGNHAPASIGPPVNFSHQFPPSPGPPPSALPAHLAPQPHPHSYHAATANNILTDNASILTLASSSKRRRRASLDTNASVRALAPSSVWGGSRESLPLSVLSGNVESIYSPQSRSVVGGFVNAERASVYSSSGVTAPALSSERNSYYKNADGASVRSGLLGHGRTDSITGSIGPGVASPLTSPREAVVPARFGQQTSDTIEAGDGTGEVREEAQTPTIAVNHFDHEKAKAPAGH